MRAVCGCVRVTVCCCVADNKIGSEDAKALAEALETNTTVTSIDLKRE